MIESWLFANLILQSKSGEKVSRLSTNSEAGLHGKNLRLKYFGDSRASHLFKVGTHANIFCDIFLPHVYVLKDTLLDGLKVEGEGVTISSDAQMNSPGHSARIAQCTSIENKYLYVVDTRTIDKRETNNSSMRMEYHGSLRSLLFLLSRLDICAWVSDQHVCVKKFFCKFFYLSVC